MGARGAMAPTNFENMHLVPMKFRSLYTLMCIGTHGIFWDTTFGTHVLKVLTHPLTWACFSTDFHTNARQIVHFFCFFSYVGYVEATSIPPKICMKKKREKVSSLEIKMIYFCHVFFYFIQNLSKLASFRHFINMDGRSKLLHEIAKNRSQKLWYVWKRHILTEILK